MMDLPEDDPRQRLYARHRRRLAAANPPVRVIDAPPALHLTPPDGPCERCGGSGFVPATAIDMIGRQLTCPACGGAG